jgi:hypothetical protein
MNESRFDAAGFSSNACCAKRPLDEWLAGHGPAKASPERQRQPIPSYAPNDQVQLALIGAGNQGQGDEAPLTNRSERSAGLVSQARGFSISFPRHGIQRNRKTAEPKPGPALRAVRLNEKWKFEPHR